MESFTLWWLIAGGLVVAELLTGSFYLLMLALSAVAGALAAHLGVSMVGQVLLAAVLGAAAVVGCYFLRKRQARAQPLQSSMNLDIGESVQVESWAADGTAQVRYRGAQWTVVLRPGNAATPGSYRVAEMIGNRLLVDKL